MIFNFDEDDVAALLETTFFVVHRYWTYLSASDRSVVHNMLSYILETYETVLVNHINQLPMLKDLDGLSDVEARLDSLRPALTTEAALDAFALRIRNETSGVTQIALVELVSYLEQHQNAVYELAVSQRPDSALARLLRTLLDCVCKYNGVQSDICKLCTESIGLIGCLDSNQIEAVREQKSIVMLSNFEESGEVTDFVIFVLEHILVPAFLSATDTRMQGYVSYAMQQLLEKCEIKLACDIHGTGRLEGNDIYRKWIGMPETVRDILTPFLDSRYTLADLSKTEASYPIFTEGKPYASWLRTIVMDLLWKPQNGHAELIFHPLMRVIRVKDLSIAEFLLPYLFLHVLLGRGGAEQEKNKQNLLHEVRAVLESQPTRALTYAETEDRKRYYHVSMVSFGVNLAHIMTLGHLPDPRLRCEMGPEKTGRNR